MTSKPHFAVIGKTGQLARALAAEVSEQGLSATFYDRAACDLSASRAEIEDFVMALNNPSAIIIAAAYTNVDGAETDRKLAMAVNGYAPTVIAKAAALRGIPVVYISTDYVFNGQGSSPYAVDAETDPVNYYGVTKRVGERGILAAGGEAAIIRTSWVYDGSGKNFLTTMLDLAQAQSEISVVNDQFGRPTYARDLANAVLCCAVDLFLKNDKAQGIFHYSNSGQVISWAEFAVSIFSVFSDEFENPVQVIPIPSADYPTKAARPVNSALELTKFERNFTNGTPHWRDGLMRAKTERSILGRQGIYDT